MVFLLPSVQAGATLAKMGWTAGMDDGRYIAHMKSTTEALSSSDRSAIESDSITLVILRQDGAYSLQWTAPPLYSCLSFTVERAWVPGYTIRGDTRWVEVGVIPGFCNVFESVAYSFIDRGSTALRDGSVQYRLSVQMLGGETVHVYSEVLHNGTPERFKIIDVFPQPARGALQASFTLPAAGNVRLRLYRTSGGIAATFDVYAPQAGIQHITLDYPTLPSGSYLLELTSSGNVARRMLRIVR